MPQGRGIYLDKAREFHGQAAAAYGAMQQKKSQTTKTSGGGSSGIGSILGAGLGIAGGVVGAVYGGPGGAALGSGLGGLIGKMFSGGTPMATAQTGSDVMASSNYDAQQNSLPMDSGSFSDYAPGYFM